MNKLFHFKTSSYYKTYSTLKLKQSLIQYKILKNTYNTCGILIESDFWTFLFFLKSGGVEIEPTIH